MYCSLLAFRLLCFFLAVALLVQGALYFFDAYLQEVYVVVSLMNAGFAILFGVTSFLKSRKSIGASVVRRVLKGVYLAFLVKFLGLTIVVTVAFWLTEKIYIRRVGILSLVLFGCYSLCEFAWVQHGLQKFWRKKQDTSS